MKAKRKFIHVDVTNDPDLQKLQAEAKAMNHTLAGYIRYLIKTHPARKNEDYLLDELIELIRRG